MWGEAHESVTCKVVYVTCSRDTAHMSGVSRPVPVNEPRKGSKYQCGVTPLVMEPWEPGAKFGNEVEQSSSRHPRVSNWMVTCRPLVQVTVWSSEQPPLRAT